MKKAAIFLSLLFFFSFIPAFAFADSTIDLRWRYNKKFHEQSAGYRIYMGDSAATTTQLIADVPKTDITVYQEYPVLLEEHFDQAPDDKYPLKSGSWTWDENTKSMKLGTDPHFMIVFEKPAGIQNTIHFRFWPEKSTSDKPILYSYIKDESDPGYYELRFSGKDGQRYSNFRKVYDSKWGGVHPDGAFGLPRYDQCPTGSTGTVECPGYWIKISWSANTYSAVAMDAVVGATDDHPLDINKLEIIIDNQQGWIDDIVIGGDLEVGRKITVDIPDTPVFFRISVYRINPDDSFKTIESSKSLAYEYKVADPDPDPDPDLKIPNPPGNLDVNAK